MTLNTDLNLCSHVSYVTLNTDLNLCSHVSYVTLNTDLNLYNKKKTLPLPQYIWIFHLVSLGLLLNE